MLAAQFGLKFKYKFNMHIFNWVSDTKRQWVDLSVSGLHKEYNFISIKNNAFRKHWNKRLVNM